MKIIEVAEAKDKRRKVQGIQFYRISTLSNIFEKQRKLDNFTNIQISFFKSDFVIHPFVASTYGNER